MYVEGYTYMSGVFTMSGKFFNDKPVYEHESGDYFVFSRISENLLVTISGYETWGLTWSHPNFRCTRPVPLLRAPCPNNKLACVKFSFSSITKIIL
eukprot:UN19288